MDLHGGSDDGVEVPGGPEGVRDIKRERTLAHADVALEGRRRRQRSRTRSELRQDGRERVGRVVSGIKNPDPKSRDSRRVDVKAEGVRAEMQGRTGGAREVGARVQDDAGESEGAGRSGADT